MIQVGLDLIDKTHSRPDVSEGSICCLDAERRNKATSARAEQLYQRAPPRPTDRNNKRFKLIVLLILIWGLSDYGATNARMRTRALG